MRAYLHRAFYDNRIGRNNTSISNTADSNQCLYPGISSNNSSSNRYNTRNRSQRYYRNLWSSVSQTQSNSNMNVNTYLNQPNRNRLRSNNNSNNGESSSARRVPVALSSHHYSMPYPAALPYPSEMNYTEPVNATAILDGNYELQFPGMFEMVDPCVEAYMSSLQGNEEKEHKGDINRVNNESTEGVCDENNNNATILSLMSDAEQTNSINFSSIDESNRDSINTVNDNMREVNTNFNERAIVNWNSEHIARDVTSNIINNSDNNNITNDINSSTQESNASLFSSFWQQTNVFNYANENNGNELSTNVAETQHVIDNNNISNESNNSEDNFNTSDSNNNTSHSILSVIVHEPGNTENRYKGKLRRHLLSRLFGLWRANNNENLKVNDRRQRCVYNNYDRSIRHQLSASPSLTSWEFVQEVITTTTTTEVEATENTLTTNAVNEFQQENELNVRGQDNYYNNHTSNNQEVDNVSVNNVNTNSAALSQNVVLENRTYNKTNNTNLHTCESYKVNVLEGGYIIFTDDFVREHPASLIATITHAYKLTSPTTPFTNENKEEMSRSRSRHGQHHIYGSNTSINRYNNNNTTSGNRNTTLHDVWDSEVDNALLNYDLVQQIREIRKCVREAQLQHRPLFRLRSANAVYGSAHYVQTTDSK